MESIFKNLLGHPGNDCHRAELWHWRPLERLDESRLELGPHCLPTPPVEVPFVMGDIGVVVDCSEAGEISPLRLLLLSFFSGTGIRGRLSWPQFAMLFPCPSMVQLPQQPKRREPTKGTRPTYSNVFYLWLRKRLQRLPDFLAKSQGFNQLLCPQPAHVTAKKHASLVNGPALLPESGGSLTLDNHLLRSAPCASNPGHAASKEHVGSRSGAGSHKK